MQELNMMEVDEVSGAGIAYSVGYAVGYFVAEFFSYSGDSKMHQMGKD